MSVSQKIMLSVRRVSKMYADDKSGLRKFSFEINSKDRVGIVGETGSGKSTLLKIIGGLLQSDAGEVFFGGERVKGPLEMLIPGHNKIAYLSQHFELPKFITVQEHLHDSYLIADREAKRIYKACRVSHLLSKHTSTLSGGEKQRVALAKILLKKPEVLLLDEPFSNLDFHHKRMIKEVMQKVEDELETTIILVAHDPLDVLSWAKHILVLSGGRVVQQARPEVVYNQPKNEYVAGLFGAFNLVSLDEFSEAGNGTFPLVKGKAIIRPEKFRLSNRTKGVRGQVVGVRYFGAYDELSVRTSASELLVRSEVNTSKVGDEVWLELEL